MNIKEIQQSIDNLPDDTSVGEISDRYHTFNELYHHRAILFSVVCAQNKEKAWKSRLHCDGTMFEGMFVVGIETPDGQATYHYSLNLYWKMFGVEEIDKAPEWDGHTANDVMDRLRRLICPECGETLLFDDDRQSIWCPKCD